MKKYFKNRFFLYIFSITVLFYLGVSLLDLNTISLHYISKYFFDSFELLYLDRALREGYIIRLVSLALNITLVLSLLVFVYKQYLIRILTVIGKFISENVKRVRISKSDKIIISILIIFMLLALKGDIDYMDNSGSIDLRNRIVGVRSSKEGHNPYFFKWKPGTSERLYDPYDYIMRNEMPYSRLTVSPTGILIYYPFASLEYSQIRTVWLCLQYLFFLSSSVLLILVLGQKETDKVYILIFCVLFSLTYIWRIHLERGQIYVLYTFLYTIMSLLILRDGGNRSKVVIGVLLSILVSLRHTFLVFLIPLFIFRKYKIIKYSVLSGIFLFLVSSLILGHDIWLQYYRSMSIYDEYAKSKSINIQTGLEGEIEGVKKIDSFSNIPNGNSSFGIILYDLFGVKSQSSLYPKIILSLLVLFALLMYFIRFWKLHISVQQLLILSSIMQIILDMLIPFPRYSYVDIMIMPVLVIIFSGCEDAKDFFFNKFGWLPVLGLLMNTSLLNTQSFVSPNDKILLGQVAMYTFLFGYFIWLIRKIIKSNVQNTKVY